MQSLYQFRWTATRRDLRYLKRALGKILYYHPSSHLDIVRHSGAHWAGYPIDRHFTTGCCTFIGGNLMHGDVKNKMLLLDPVLRLRIEPFLTQLVN